MRACTVHQDLAYRMSLRANKYKTAMQQVQSILSDKDVDKTFSKLSQVESIVSKVLTEDISSADNLEAKLEL